MQTNTAAQFNINFIRLPVNATFYGLSLGKLQVIAEIFSFSGEDKNGKQLTCRRTYKKFGERCNVSRATVGRALKFGRENNLYEVTKESGYVSKIEAQNGSFYRLPSWVCQEEFDVRKNKRRKLRYSERQVYAVIYTECTKDGNNKHAWNASNLRLALKTGLSERTVERAVWTLIRAKLIYRSDKGVNAHKLSRFVLNYRLVLAKEKSAAQIKKEVEKTMRREHQERTRQFKPAIDTPPNALPDDSEKFTLHDLENKPKKRSRRRRRFMDINIPEMDLYSVKGESFFSDHYDFSSATTEELITLHTFYSPIFKDLNIVQQAFISYIRFELEEREQQERGKDPPGGES